MFSFHDNTLDETVVLSEEALRGRAAASKPQQHTAEAVNPGGGRDSTLTEEKLLHPSDTGSTVWVHLCGERFILQQDNEPRHTSPDCPDCHQTSNTLSIYEGDEKPLTIVDEVFEDLFAADLHSVMQQRAAGGVLQQDVGRLLVELHQLHNTEKLNFHFSFIKYTELKF